ncbi:MAG: thioredoxin family protein [Desulfuromonadales bacterium]|nr:thioredoxin family protein [Desulfuromonadales bacterium]
MRIDILGDDCAKCRRLHDNVHQAVEERGLAVEITRTNDPELLARYAVRSLPGLVIDGVLESSGKFLSVAEITRLLESRTR